MQNTAEIIEKLEIKCALQEQQIAELTAKLNWFEEQFRLSQQQRFDVPVRLPLNKSGSLTKQKQRYSLSLLMKK